MVMSNVIKKYNTYSKNYWRLKTHSLLPSICPKCDGSLKHVGYKAGSCKWLYYQECSECKRKYEFMPNDMGQGSDYFARIKEFIELSDE